MRSGRKAFGTNDLVVFCLFAEEAFARPDQDVGEGLRLLAIAIAIVGFLHRDRFEKGKPQLARLITVSRQSLSIS